MSADKAGKAVDTGGIVVGLIGTQAFGAFFVGPVDELVAFALVLIVRDREAAGEADPLHLDLDDGTGDLGIGEMTGKGLKIDGALFVDDAFAVEPADLGFAFEGAEHDDDATVFTEMGNGLDTTAIEIEVGDLIGSKDAEGVGTFG